MSTSTSAGPTIVGPSSAGLLMTPEEFDAIAELDDRFDYELIHGVLIVTPIPSEAESDPNEELGFLLQSLSGEPSAGIIPRSHTGRALCLHSKHAAAADRVIWAGLGRLPDPRIDVPTIVAEFVSADRRDRQRDYEQKRIEYLALGIQEYWVIDRFHRRLTVFRPGREQGSFLEIQVFEDSPTYQSSLLPGFHLPLARLLAVADRWK